MIVKAGVSLSLQGCKIEVALEIEDGSTDLEIEESVREWALQYVEWWHEKEPTK